MLSIKHLKRLTSFSLVNLAKDTGLKEGTLRAKLQHSRELNVIESEKISKVLEEKYGITVSL